MKNTGFSDIVLLLASDISCPSKCSSSESKDAEHIFQKRRGIFQDRNSSRSIEICFLNQQVQQYALP